MSLPQPLRRRDPPGSSDVLERALDKGVAFDFSAELALAGVQIAGATGRVTIVSIELYLGHEARAPASQAVISAVEEYLRGLPSGGT
jgi:hypothetical protein